MRYYVDTEFNGNEGQLLSIALVRQDGLEFYRELDVYQLVQPWVKQHVMPLMTEKPVSRHACKNAMAKFLAKDTTPVTLVGDWPEDVVHVCNLLLRDHGKRNSPVSFRCLVLDLPGFNTADHSAVPHNALEDARVLHKYVETGISEGRDGSLAKQDFDLLQGT